ncbi:hypothetical protein UA08_04826 [Talaromyces atroroseus]|uniref:Uncharacterized protein n=1 Tax=Talaromyces atroroseus TaxID=1441469 RepID=A0A225AKN0_TALAT|nr:hypothetical protein UA08_04826 [Talaromyces atroroseus]OKL59953.1 hypothetical protein UA08_04826 [Talaromyces atroroseus]
MIFNAEDKVEVVAASIVSKPIDSKQKKRYERVRDYLIAAIWCLGLPHFSDSATVVDHVWKDLSTSIVCEASLTDLGFPVLIVAPIIAALQAISKTIFEKLPGLNEVKVAFAGAETTNKFSEGNKQATKENVEYAMFRLLQSMASLRSVRYDVIPAHDLHKHVEGLVTAMKDRGEKLLFKYQRESTDD